MFEGAEQESNIGKTIRAIFSKGVIKPLEEVDVADGKEVFVTIVEVPTSSKEDASEKSAGGWKGTIDAEKLIKDIYSDRLISTRKETNLFRKEMLCLIK